MRPEARRRWVRPGSIALRGPILVTVLGMALVPGLGCFKDKEVRVDFSETPRDYLPADYEGVHERWTRHGVAQQEVDIALEVWATFKSWDFREAYIERYASIYSLSDTDRSTLRQAQLDAFGHSYEFTMAALSANYHWNDLEKTSSAWRVTLIDAVGHELTPEPIKIEKLPDAYEREFFPAPKPFEKAFTKTYRIRFTVPPESDFSGLKSGAIVLRIASPIGRIDLRWQG